jgi:hypothetical protein
MDEHPSHDNVPPSGDQDRLLKHTFTYSANSGGPRSSRPESTFRDWWQELALSLYATGLLAAITATLAAFNGQPQPNWSLGINLSTIAAFLATFLRSTLIMIIEQGKSDLQRPTSKPLTHFSYWPSEMELAATAEVAPPSRALRRGQ